MKPAPLLPMPCLALSAAMAATSAVLCLCLMSKASGESLKAHPIEMEAPRIIRTQNAANAGGVMAPIQELNPAFTTDLYQQLRATEGNVFYSPYSISQAMGMVYAGSRENTATEIAKALSFPKPPDETGALMRLQRKQLAQSVNQKGDELAIANALCVTNHVPLQDYQTLVREQFDGELIAGGLDEINAWVKKQTRGHIESIMSQLDPNSACVILNAVYFKGNWQTAFDPQDTHDAKFHVADGKSKTVKMMHCEAEHIYAAHGNWVAVELPYRGNSSMVLMMPAKADQFEAFEAGINQNFIAEVDQKLALAKQRPKDVSLYMPKFKIATEYDLMEPMANLGVRDAYNDAKSNFSAMYERSDIAIGQIKHKATLEVDEQGSVATAVTDIEMRANVALEPAPEVRFDRPFIVRIKEKNSNATLFIGRISDPTQ